MIEIEAKGNCSRLGRVCQPEDLRYNTFTSMISGRMGCELATVAVLCVLVIFLFPSMQGPYSVVHGPVTALLAVRTAARLRSVIAQSALHSLGKRLLSPLAALSWPSISNTEFHSFSLPEYDTILRC